MGVPELLLTSPGLIPGGGGKDALASASND